MVDKDVLRQLGWSAELIEAAFEATRPSEPPFASVVMSELEGYDVGVGSSELDISDAPAVASNALPPPPATR